MEGTGAGGVTCALPVYRGAQVQVGQVQVSTLNNSHFSAGHLLSWILQYMFPLQTAVWGRSGGVQAYKGHPSQTSPDSEAGSFPWQPSARGQCQCRLLFLGDQADNGKHGEEVGRELGHRRQEDESGKLTFERAADCWGYFSKIMRKWKWSTDDKLWTNWLTHILKKRVILINNSLCNYFDHVLCNNNLDMQVNICDILRNLYFNKKK